MGEGGPPPPGGAQIPPTVSEALLLGLLPDKRQDIKLNFRLTTNNVSAYVWVFPHHLPSPPPITLATLPLLDDPAGSRRWTAQALPLNLTTLNSQASPPSTQHSCCHVYGLWS